MFPTALIVIMALGMTAGRSAAEGDPKAVGYEKDILPTFREHCFECHDGHKKKASLRLDVRSDAMKAGESGKVAIVPGKAAESEVYRRLIAHDDNERMPPKRELTKLQIAAVKEWIDAGAKWPDALANESAKKHWAFVAPVRPVAPATGHPIDAFVHARLTQEGLKPSPEAEATTLCRRLYLDLLGLPPTPPEVDEFLADPSPGRVGTLVDKLLKSPHYGERWGRLWLDTARYADSNGYETDAPRPVWFYRDWVIDAFNNDLPYDQFIIEQLAGDLLPKPTQSQIVATGYLRNSMINEEGGVDAEHFRMEMMFDRMDAIGKGVLGLTIQCAQCHTHKYDPIRHEDYYRLFAYLNTSLDAYATVYTPEEQRQRADVLRGIRDIEDNLKHRTPNWAARLAAWERSVAGNQPAWEILRPEIDGSGSEKLLPQPDGSLVGNGDSPAKDTRAFPVKSKLKTITGFRLEAMLHPEMPHGGPGRAPNGLFALSELIVTLNGKKVPLTRASSDLEIPETAWDVDIAEKAKKKRVVGPSWFAIDDKNETAWSIDIGPGRSNVARKAVFAFEKPLVVPADAKLVISLAQLHGASRGDYKGRNLGRFRFAATDAESPVADPLPSVVRNIIENIPAEKRTTVQADAVFTYWRTLQPEWKAANDEIDTLWKRHPVGTSQLTLHEQDEPRQTHRLTRGDFLTPAERVTPGTPGFLHPLDPKLPANRLGLARWLVDPKSPTTARAFVNRVWQAYFGTGLVSTSEDLGVQCDPPSHPELLDWLACEFMAPSDGSPAWSVKHLHRLIVSSATYQQTSRVTPELVTRDPKNRLLARGPRFRLDAEVVRDVALTASGLLNETIGGPSVFPPVPVFLMLPPSSFQPKTWPVSSGPDRYRRSLYVFSYRSVPYPPLQTFDAPNGEVACVRRARSNTPLQALTAMNEPMFLEAAKALATRIVKDAGTGDAERLTLAFRLCTSRAPSEAELKILAGLLAKERGRAEPADEWLAIARVMLNLDETLTKE
ncbi:PSD1 and planctomycete cytochrome C domain-containing protein [soil metagenome]